MMSSKKTTSAVAGARSSGPAPPPKPGRKSAPKHLLARVEGATGRLRRSKQPAEPTPTVGEEDHSAPGTSRIDVIDQLDISGIAGSTLFHHDSPYDACSPHRNINQRAAPVRAFDARVDPVTGQLLERHRAEQEVEGGEDAARSLRAPADPRRHYADEEGEPDPQNTDYWGMPTEPWQEMQETRPPPAVRPGHSRQSSASSGVDMETILSGGRRKQGGTQSWLPEDAPAASTALGGARAGGSDSKVQRSTSFMGKLRRLRLDPDEVVGSGASSQRRRSMMVPSSVSEMPNDTEGSNPRLRRNNTVMASSQPQEETAAPASRPRRSHRTTVESSTRQARTEPPAVPPKQQQGGAVVQEPAIPAYLSTRVSTPAAGGANTQTWTSAELGSPTERSSPSERAGQERPRTLLGRLASTRRK